MSGSSPRARYGDWGLVAGAAQGIGAAIADAYAAAGVNLVLLDRQGDRLHDKAGDLRDRHQVEVRPVVVDLAVEDIWGIVEPVVKDIEVGLFVYNAVQGFGRPFLEDDLDYHLSGIRTNVQTPAVLTWHLGRAMAARGRGSIVLVSSLAAMAGMPGRAHYAATKAYQRILAESLWGELRERGVDVVAYMVGMTATEGLLATFPQAGDPEFRKTSGMVIDTPEAVAHRLVRLLDQGPEVFSNPAHEPT